MSTSSPTGQGQQPQQADQQAQAAPSVPPAPSLAPVQQMPHIIQSSSGEVLQAATAIAGIAVAFVVLLPASSMAKFAVLTIGTQKILPLNVALLIVGALSLGSSAWTIRKLRREEGISLADFWKFKSPLTLLLVSLFVLALIYLSVCISS